MPIRFREVRRRLRHEGFNRVRQHGSHEIWKNPVGGRTVVVAGRDSDDVPEGTWRSIKKQAHWL